MLNIAIVEDELPSAQQLESCIRQYSVEYRVPVQIYVFSNALSFPSFSRSR